MKTLNVQLGFNNQSHTPPQTITEVITKDIETCITCYIYESAPDSLEEPIEVLFKIKATIGWASERISVGSSKFKSLSHESNVLVDVLDYVVADGVVQMYSRRAGELIPADFDKGGILSNYCVVLSSCEGFKTLESIKSLSDWKRFVERAIIQCVRDTNIFL